MTQKIYGPENELELKKNNPQNVSNNVRIFFKR